MAQTKAPHTRQLQSIGPVRTSFAPISLPRKRWDRTLTLEAAAVAILLVALIASIAGRGGNGGGEQITANAVINAPGTEEAHTTSMYRLDPGRTNLSPDAGPGSVPKVDWRVNLNDESVIAAADGVVVTVPTNSQELHGWSLETGNPLWSAMMDGMNPDRGVAAGDGYVIVAPGADKPTVAAYDLQTGALAWSSEQVGTIATQPAIAGGKLYFLSMDRKLQVVDMKTGESLWSVDVTAEASKATPDSANDETYYNVLNSFTLAVGEGVVLVTGGDGIVTAYDIESHETVWSFTSGGPYINTPLIADGAVYLYAENEDRTQRTDPNAKAWNYRLDAKTGSEVWKQEYDVNGAYGSAAVVGLVAADVLRLQDGSLISTADGSILGALPKPEGENAHYGAWMFGNGVAYSVDGEGNLIAWTYDAATYTFSESWRAYLAVQPYEGSGMQILGDRLLARGPNGTLLSLSADPSLTAANAEATPGTADISGLTPCAPPPPVDWQNVSGEPANTIASTSAMISGQVDHNAPEATVVNTVQNVDGYGNEWDVSILSDPTRQPWLDFPDLPTGQPAPADAIAGINATLQAIKDCDQAGMTTDMSGYFSEDFFRRSWVQAEIVARGEQASQQQIMSGLALSAGVHWLNEIQSVTVLEDGRVAVVGKAGFNVVDNFAMLTIFVKQGDTWVIDEAIRVGIDALMG